MAEPIDLIAQGFIDTAIVVGGAIGLIVLALIWINVAIALDYRIRFPYGTFLAAHMIIIPLVLVVGGSYHLLVGTSPNAAYKALGTALAFYLFVCAILVILVYLDIDDPRAKL